MKRFLVFAVIAGAAILAPNAARACACGCGVFDVATESMLPQGPGGMLYLEYDYMDQNMNWSHSSPAPTANNGDRDIRTDFVTLGFQYMFNRDWGVQVEVPYDFRSYQATAGGSTSWSTIGDIRLQGIYTGFSPDMSAGVTFGLKLPTGNDTHDMTTILDRDTELGTGSTDALLGGFYRHTLSSVAHGLYWFAQVQLDVPVLIQGGYRPGIEVDTSLGLYYQGLSIGKVYITPVAQVIPSERTSDTGSWASGGVNDPPVGEIDSGYQRILLSPGIEFDIHPVMIYADAEFDVLQLSRGNQLVSPVLFKVAVSYKF
jgi:opacity protein-like surface antigen